MNDNDREALIDEYGRIVLYRELYEKGRELSSAIAERCLVFCLCRNSIGAILGYTAFLRGKIVPVLLNVHLERQLLDHLMDTYCPAYLWLPEEMKGNFPDFDEVYASCGYCLLFTNYQKNYPLHDELALLMTTSGSTGSPKFVRQSYANIKANTESIIRYLQLDKSERPITTLPMNYTYGLSIINTHLLAGAVILVTDKGLMQKEFWDFFRAQGATSFGGVPYTYEMLERLRFTQMDLPSLKTMTQAGGKIAPELHRKFAEYAEKTNKKFVVMYGQCEATARMGYLPPEKAVEKCGSMGIAIPGGKFRLIDADGNEITDAHRAGELVYEGANVTMGYAECGGDLARGDERHGILETGDMAEVDEDGYYYIVGRKKRFLKIYGNRVNLDEIDRMIRGAFAGLDAACGGVDDHMYVFMDDPGRTSEVREYIARKTGLNHAAFQMIAIDQIPRNDSGKVLYKELEKYYV